MLHYLKITIVTVSTNLIKHYLVFLIGFWSLSKSRTSLLCDANFGRPTLCVKKSKTGSCNNNCVKLIPAAAVVVVMMTSSSKHFLFENRYRLGRMEERYEAFKFDHKSGYRWRNGRRGCLQRERPGFDPSHIQMFFLSGNRWLNETRHYSLVMPEWKNQS